MLPYKSVIVDGERISGYIYDDDRKRECYGFEEVMRETGYPLVPKLNGYGCKEDPSITKQDLVDHPDWFEPYKFPLIAILSWGGWTFEDSVECFRYKDGKWDWDESKSSDPCARMDHTPKGLNAIAQDVAYMKQWYPELYKKVLELNELQEDDSGNLIPAAPQQGKPHTPKPGSAFGAKKSNTAGQTPVITRMNKPDSVPQPDGLKSPVITVPTNDDVTQMLRTLSTAIKARLLTMSSRDEMTKFAEEITGVLQEECVSAGFIVAGEDVEINYTYISESLDFNNIAAAI